MCSHCCFLWWAVVESNHPCPKTPRLQRGWAPCPTAHNRNWTPVRESNPPPRCCRPLHGRSANWRDDLLDACMVWVRGLEPPASWFAHRRALPCATPSNHVASTHMMKEVAACPCSARPPCVRRPASGCTPPPSGREPRPGSTRPRRPGKRDERPPDLSQSVIPRRRVRSSRGTVRGAGVEPAPTRVQSPPPYQLGHPRSPHAQCNKKRASRSFAVRACLIALGWCRPHRLGPLRSRRLGIALRAGKDCRTGGELPGSRVAPRHRAYHTGRRRRR